MSRDFYTELADRLNEGDLILYKASPRNYRLSVFFDGKEIGGEVTEAIAPPIGEDGFGLVCRVLLDEDGNFQIDEKGEDVLSTWEPGWVRVVDTDA